MNWDEREEAAEVHEMLCDRAEKLSVVIDDMAGDE